MTTPTRDGAGLAPGAGELHDDTLAALCRPPAGTIKAAVLDALRRGDRLTSLTALQRYGTSRLAAIVHQLRRDGWPIEARTVAIETAHGHTAHVAQYSMTGGA